MEIVPEFLRTASFRRQVAEAILRRQQQQTLVLNATLVTGNDGIHRQRCPSYILLHWQKLWREAYDKAYDEAATRLGIQTQAIKPENWRTNIKSQHHVKAVGRHRRILASFDTIDQKLNADIDLGTLMPEQGLRRDTQSIQPFEKRSVRFYNADHLSRPYSKKK